MKLWYTLYMYKHMYEKFKTDWKGTPLNIPGPVIQSSDIKMAIKIVSLNI